MDKVAAITTAIIAFFLALFLIPLVGIGVGAFIGWVAGLVFPGTIGIIASAITGGATMPAWQVGAILGFVGGFFKTRLIASKD